MSFLFFFCKRSATWEDGENPFLLHRPSFFFIKTEEKTFSFSSCVFLFFCAASLFAEIRWRKQRKKREIHDICLLGENEREKEEERKGVMPYGEDIRERETKDAQELDGEA